MEFSAWIVVSRTDSISPAFIFARRSQSVIKSQRNDKAGGMTLRRFGSSREHAMAALVQMYRAVGRCAADKLYFISSKAIGSSEAFRLKPGSRR